MWEDRPDERLAATNALVRQHHCPFFAASDKKRRHAKSGRCPHACCTYPGDRHRDVRDARRGRLEHLVCFVACDCHNLEGRGILCVELLFDCFQIHTKNKIIYINKPFMCSFSHLHTLPSNRSTMSCGSVTASIIVQNLQCR